MPTTSYCTSSKTKKALGSKNKTDFQNTGIRALESQLYFRRNAFNHRQKIQFSKTESYVNI